ncbi:AMP-binding protein [Escherichia coli]
MRAGRSIPLKKNVDDALKNPNVTSVEHVVVLKRTGGKIDWQEGRDLWWHDLVEQASDQHQAEEMNAEDPLFILYTSGSTGKPKGVLHTTGGYLVYAALTFKYALIVVQDNVLVHRRCGLGDRTQLLAVRPAGLRCDHADV